MLLRELKETNGTYVAVVPNLATEMLLREWAVQNGIELVENLHVTLLYSRNKIAVTPTTIDYPCVPVAFEKFDDDCLVITLDSTALVRRHEQLIKAGGTSDYPTFNPHLTIVKGSKIDTSQLKLPDFAMTFTNEYTEPLDLSK